MQEELAVTLLVTRVLDQLGVRYLVGGSLASSLHGVPRATQDADVVADLQEYHVPTLIAFLQNDFYIDETAVRDAVRDRASFNAIHLKTMFKVDVFVARGDADSEGELARRQHYPLEGSDRDIVVASPEDVIVHKLYWYRLGDQVSERQWSDALGVLKTRGAHLDLEHMRQRAASMGVEDLLERALLAVASSPGVPPQRKGEKTPLATEASGV